MVRNGWEVSRTEFCATGKEAQDGMMMPNRDGEGVGRTGRSIATQKCKILCVLISNS